ncbi:MAG: D-alanine--D-alanine ligase [Lachnospiraceae bacterium]|nr:D-alanine--D-alanine ligase [Lachnospiraceae bacterium]MBQ8263011.1 D-alanine--D-alanine ligase [Lachnospiraceae bacterium]
MKIVVLAGGTSTERFVSLISGMQIYKALKSKGHETVLLDVYLGYDGPDADHIFTVEKDWSEGIEAVSTENPDLEKIKALRKDGGKCFFGPNVIEICKQADVVFMALHGACGEDGRIQAALELYGIPFTGTDYLSSAIAMDKALTKELLTAKGIPMAKGFSMEVDGEIKEIGYPAVVKVNTGGSSVGVYMVSDEKELKEALKKASAFDHRVVVEEFIDGREFTCGVIDGKALPVVEIAPSEGFYDYTNKYQPGKTKDTCPADLPADKTAEIQAVAEKVFTALRLRAYARIDFMMNRQGDIFCLEANTLPGMTPVSLLPMEAAAVGMDFPALCEKLIEVSLK